MESKSETKSETKMETKSEAKLEAKWITKLVTKLKSKHNIIPWLMNIVLMVILLHKSHYNLLQSNGSIKLFDPGSDGRNRMENGGRDRDGIGWEIRGMENHKTESEFKAAVSTNDDNNSIGSINIKDSISGGNDNVKMINDSIGGISGKGNVHIIGIKSGNNDKCIKQYSDMLQNNFYYYFNYEYDNIVATKKKQEGYRRKKKGSGYDHAKDDIQDGQEYEGNEIEHEKEEVHDDKEHEGNEEKYHNQDLIKCKYSKLLDPCSVPSTKIFQK